MIVVHRGSFLYMKVTMLATSGEEYLALLQPNLHIFLHKRGGILHFTPNIYWMHKRLRRLELHFPVCTVCCFTFLAGSAEW